MKDKYKTREQLINELEELPQRITELEVLEIESKQMEGKIQQINEEWETTFNSITDLVSIQNKDFKLVKVNKAYADAFKARPEELIGKPCYEVIHGMKEPCLNCPHQETLKTKKSIAKDIFEPRLGIHLEVSTSPIFNKKGEVTGSVHIAKNITERIKVDEALRGARDELEGKVEKRTAELTRSNEQLRKEIEERKRIEETLKKSEKQLQSLSSQLLTFQEKERKRIAQELHDSVGQTLAALKYSVENTLNKIGEGTISNCFKSLEDLIPKIQNSVEEVDKIGKGLRPSILDDLGILATFSWFCREFKSVYSDIQIEKEITLEEDEVPEPLKVVIYRILQESLNNIAKHSGANLVHIALEKTNSTIKFTIKDNGKEFDLKNTLSPENNKSGLGLISMIKRTELSGGALVINSNSGTGTTINASWPN